MGGAPGSVAQRAGMSKEEWASTAAVVMRTVFVAEMRLLLTMSHKVTVTAPSKKLPRTVLKPKW